MARAFVTVDATTKKLADSTAAALAGQLKPLIGGDSTAPGEGSAPSTTLTDNDLTLE